MWTTPHNKESKKAQFIKTIRNFDLYQHLLEPTGSLNTDNPSLIDLVLTNEVIQVSDTFGKGVITLLKLNLNKSCGPEEMHPPNFRRISRYCI